MSYVAKLSLSVEAVQDNDIELEVLLQLLGLLVWLVLLYQELLFPILKLHILDDQ